MGVSHSMCLHLLLHQHEVWFDNKCWWFSLKTIRKLWNMFVMWKEVSCRQCGIWGCEVFLDVLKQLIWRWGDMGQSQCVGEFNWSMLPWLISFVLQLQLWYFMHCPLPLWLAASCPLLSWRPHHISVCNMSAENLCLSYSLSTVYSICATMALKLQSALGTQKGGPITAQATEAGS